MRRGSRATPPLSSLCRASKLLHFNRHHRWRRLPARKCVHLVATLNGAAASGERRKFPRRPGGKLSPRPWLVRPIGGHCATVGCVERPKSSAKMCSAFVCQWALWSNWRARVALARRVPRTKRPNISEGGLQKEEGRADFKEQIVACAAAAAAAAAAAGVHSAAGPESAASWLRRL